jgi:hypothetical protein
MASPSDSDEDTVEIVSIRVASLKRLRNLDTGNDGDRNAFIRSATHSIVVLAQGSEGAVLPYRGGGISVNVTPRARAAHLADLTFSGPFAEAAAQRLFFVSLQQEVMTHHKSSAIDVVRVAGADKLAPVMATLYDWVRLGDAWTWQIPTRSLGITNAHEFHALSNVERAVLGLGSDEHGEYTTAGGALDVHVRMDAFVRAPVQQAQDMDGDEAPARIKNNATFEPFFQRIVEQCRALGNRELDSLDGELRVISIDYAARSRPLDPRHVRVLVAYLVAVARVFVRPLFISTDAVSVLLEAADNLPFALVPGPRPELVPLAEEDYVVFVPQKRPLDPRVETEPRIVEIASDSGESDDDETDASPRKEKRPRLTYGCAHCGKERARFLAPLLPMCGTPCIRDYFY